MIARRVRSSLLLSRHRCDAGPGCNRRASAAIIQSSARAASISAQPHRVGGAMCDCRMRGALSCQTRSACPLPTLLMPSRSVAISAAAAGPHRLHPLPWLRKATSHRASTDRKRPLRVRKNAVCNTRGGRRGGGAAKDARDSPSRHGASPQGSAGDRPPGPRPLRARAGQRLQKRCSGQRALLE